MQQLDLVIYNETGLHARPAKALVKLAKSFDSDIKIQHGEKKVNAKSMISVLTLGVKKSGRIFVEIDGDDEVAASEAIESAVVSGLGEEVKAPKTNGHTVAHKMMEQKLADNQMKGIPASTGLAHGPVFRWSEKSFDLPSDYAGAAEELKQFADAVLKTRTELNALVIRITADLSAEEAEIFNAHLEILADQELQQEVKDRIKAGENSAQSWYAVCDAQANALSQIDDETLAARSADVRDVCGRLLAHLLNQSQSGKTLHQPSILLARDLSPSDTASLNANLVLAFVTSEGGPNAHSAIIARAMGIPAVVGLGPGMDSISDDATLIVNGATGLVEVNPSDESIEKVKAEQDKQAQKAAAMLAVAKDFALTQDGVRVEVFGNGGSAADCGSCKGNGAEGIGLLRTEFLFLGKNEEPSEAEQYDTYSNILSVMDGRTVIFRTLDIGGDKPVPYITVPNEENPFLGERGVRLMINHYPEMLRTQLKALLRAYRDSGTEKMGIMFPMVGQLSEWRKAKQHTVEVSKELGISLDGIEMGVMIEVPSAALNAVAFAQEVDFFSIGTNDLTQYTMAIDRQHPTLAGQADGLDPAVLRLIAMTADAAHGAGKWVGVCGELAADPAATQILIGLGIDELSVNNKAIPSLKDRIRNSSKAQCEKVAQKALSLSSAAEVRALG
ncbi:MAG: phosphoenolpyruvate--protein phosphotransferase [Chloroflexota bacterium]